MFRLSKSLIGSYISAFIILFIPSPIIPMQKVASVLLDAKNKHCLNPSKVTFNPVYLTTDIVDVLGIRVLSKTLPEIERLINAGKITCRSDLRRHLENNHAGYDEDKVPLELNDKEAENMFKKAENAEALGVWTMPKCGWRINGRLFTEHALERMAPNTCPIEQELRSRHASSESPEPLSIAPSEIINILEISDGTPLLKDLEGATMRYSSKTISVDTNKKGDVVNVSRNN